jgi:transcriptional regulator with XRE-family HTH domain
MLRTESTGYVVTPVRIRIRSCMEQTRMSKMIFTGRNKQNDDSANSPDQKHESTGLISLPKLLQILTSGRKTRSQFVESHLNKSIAYQIRSLRDQEKWTQAEFADKLGIKHSNNVSARLENPNYGKLTLSTLKQIAATCDVALVVWFIPFSRFLKWVTGTPYLDNGLSESFYKIPTFDDEYEDENHLGRVPPDPLNELTTQIERHRIPEPDQPSAMPLQSSFGSISDAHLAG